MHHKAKGSNSSNKEYFVKNLLIWGNENRRPFPWRKDLDPFKILVSEILLQRSRATTVAQIYPIFIKKWPTADRLSRARVEDIKEVIKPLGLTSRSETLKAVAQKLSNDNLRFDKDSLLGAKGIGNYIASTTANSSGISISPIWDSVSRRVYGRFFGISIASETRLASKPRETKKLQNLVMQIFPARKSSFFNWAVLDLAAEVCLPKVPLCEICPLSKRCVWRNKNRG